jgi:phospholipid-binding lipoprotein MlaA
LILYLLAQAAVFAGRPEPTAMVPDILAQATIAESQVPQFQSDTDTIAPGSPRDNGAASPSESSSARQAQPEQPDDDGIVVTARKHDPADPLEQINVKSFAVTQAVDEKITAPLAHAYEHGLPKPIRQGLHNFLGNLHEPDVFINFLLQHKFGKAAETVGRFAIDTTAGAGGFIDIAKRHPFNLPRRQDSFADTLGFYGVKPGAFLFVPLMGPTTIRDLAGGLLDRLVLPGIPNTPFSGPSWAVSAGVVHTLDQRVQFDDELARERASDDPYAARREFYLHKRQAEIDALHGKGNLLRPALAAATPSDR